VRWRFRFRAHAIARAGGAAARRRGEGAGRSAGAGQRARAWCVSRSTMRTFARSLGCGHHFTGNGATRAPIEPASAICSGSPCRCESIGSSSPPLLSRTRPAQATQPTTRWAFCTGGHNAATKLIGWTKREMRWGGGAHSVVALRIAGCRQLDRSDARIGARSRRNLNACQAQKKSSLGVQAVVQVAA